MKFIDDNSNQPTIELEKDNAEDIEIHIEALKRNQKLMLIKEDAENLIAVNNYISHLLEEKKEPIDHLLTNMEESEIYVIESNRQLNIHKNRIFKCSDIKYFLKVLFFIFCLLIFCKLLAILNFF